LYKIIAQETNMQGYLFDEENFPRNTLIYFVSKTFCLKFIEKFFFLKVCKCIEVILLLYICKLFTKKKFSINLRQKVF